MTVKTKIAILNAVRILNAYVYKHGSDEDKKQIVSDVDTMYDTYLNEVDMDGYVVADVPTIYCVDKPNLLPA